MLYPRLPIQEAKQKASSIFVSLGGLIEGGVISPVENGTTAIYVYIHTNFNMYAKEDYADIPYFAGFCNLGLGNEAYYTIPYCKNEPSQGVK